MQPDSFSCLDKDRCGSLLSYSSALVQLCSLQAMFASGSVYVCVYGSLREHGHICVRFKAAVTYTVLCG